MKEIKHGILTDAQIEQSREWAEMNTCPYPLGWYLATIDDLRCQLERAEADSDPLRMENARLRERVEELEKHFKDAVNIALDQADRSLQPAALLVETVACWCCRGDGNGDHVPGCKYADPNTFKIGVPDLAPDPPADPRREAVAAARPEIEREAWVTALGWARNTYYSAGDPASEVNARIKSLRAEGGKP